MTPHQHKANHLLQHFAQAIHTPLQLKDGVCALFDAQGIEVAIIEVPEHSDSAIFHGALLPLSSDTPPQALHQLLRLNFEISAMQGCWLAIDEQDKLCLCYVLPLDRTDEQHFGDSLNCFIAQVKDVRAYSAEVLRHAAA
ncbi:type III secretion system chaperone [Billgrantia sp. Q4P2]|uniref:type III secretion system chaperone n=1 Tax=Billgrantia sp. Q4P2 TaxID=3463857 RepID=UPI0040570C5C